MSAPTEIIPTIGRKLWLFIDQTCERRHNFADVRSLDPAQPFDASIAYVYPDKKETDFFYIRVTFADHEGAPHTAVVPLRQAGQCKPVAREWAEWMPYQQGQAKKDAPVETKVYSDGAQAAGVATLPALSPAQQAAIETLKRLGYEWDGGVLWRPPAQEPRVNELSFGDAIVAMKRKCRVTRAGWNGKGMWLFIIQGSNDIAKLHGYGFGEHAGEPAFRDAIFMRTVDNQLVPWTASQSDVLANDWSILQ